MRSDLHVTFRPRSANTVNAPSPEMPTSRGPSVCRICGFAVCRPHSLSGSSLSDPRTHWRPTLVAGPAEEHLHARHGKPLAHGWHPEALDVDDHATHLAAACADEVMVGMLHVRIDPHTACSQVDQRDLPKCLEVVNRLVHRAERDRGHLRSGFLAEALHGGV